MITWLANNKATAALIVSIVLIATGVFFGWEEASIIFKGRENAHLAAERKDKITELEETISALEEKVKLHNAEAERLEKQHIADRAFFAKLQKEILDFKHVAATPTEPPDIEVVVVAPELCHEKNEKNSIDPVIPDRLRELYDDAKARLR